MNVVARPRSLFTFAFDCFDTDDEIIASFRHRAFRSRGSIRVAEVEHEVARAGVGLVVRREGGGRPLVEINAHGRGQMTVGWSKGELGIARAGIGFRMLLVSNGRTVGKLGLRDLFGRTMILDSEIELPPVVVASLFWMAVARRRQLLMIGT